MIKRAITVRMSATLYALSSKVGILVLEGAGLYSAGVACRSDIKKSAAQSIELQSLNWTGLALSSKICPKSLLGD
jgi:hypothetical protein